MRLTRTTAWAGGAVLLALAVCAATWLLLVSPRQQLAADLRDQTAATAAPNDLLQAQVLQLEAELGDVPQTRAEVAALREQVPVDADLATLLRQVTELSDRAGANLTGVTPTEPATAAGAEATAAAEAGTTGATAPPAPGVQVVPVTITATGTFSQVQDLLRLVQVELPRAVLVRSVALTSGEDAGALQLALTADAFALPTTPQEEQLAAAAASTGAAPADLGAAPAGPEPSAAPTSAPATGGAPVPATTAAPLDAAAPTAPEEVL